MLAHTYREILAALRQRLREKAPGHVQLVCGPRQVGKTTLLSALAAEFAPGSRYAAADAPAAWLPGWWERLWQEAETAAAQAPLVLLIDEIHCLGDWQRRLKSQIDHLRRRALPIHVVVSGSSALQLGRGARETLAGRFERLRLLHWPAAELAAAFQVPAATAAEQAVRFGCFPGAVPLLGEPDRWRAYVRDSIIEPAIGRDLLLLEPVRKPALLRQLFALSAGHPAEILSLQKLAGQLLEQGTLETVSHYLDLLAEACLVAAVPKYSAKLLRQRAAPRKLVVLNNAFLAALTPGGAPDPAAAPAQWGRWVENACLALAWNAGQEVHYWRQEPWEVDLVVTGSWGRWAVEVKTGTFTGQDLTGLLQFCRRYPDFQPLVVCAPGQEAGAARAGLAHQYWQDFLLVGPGATATARS